MQIIYSVLTIFLLMMMGYGALRSRMLDNKGISAISTVVLYFAQPCLILYKMQQDVTPQLMAELGLIFVLTCVIMGASGTAAWFLFRRQPHDRRAVLANLVMASNCGFMGYPIIEAAMGADAVIYAVMYVSAFNLMCWTLGSYFYRGPSAMSVKKILLNPTILAVIGGFVLMISGLRLPEFINSAMNYMGGITTPCAMFVIGARLMGVKLSDLADRSLLLTCGLRLLVVPLIALPLLKLAPLTPNVAGALYLCSAMPCASLTGMQADVFDCEKSLASRGVALSTAISLGTVPLLLMLL